MAGDLPAAPGTNSHAPSSIPPSAAILTSTFEIIAFAAVLDTDLAVE
jgi:hypothetical protein